MGPKALTTLLCCLGTSAALAQTPRYTATPLTPLPGHYRLYTNAINNHGAVVGLSYASPSNATPFLYTRAEGVRVLPLPPGGYAYSVPQDINDDGVIVGYAQPTWSAEQSMVAWKYQDGQFTVYSPEVSFANSINNAGTLVGRSCLSGSQLTCYFKAEPGGAPETVGPANFYSSSWWRLVDINDLGQILYTPGTGAGAAALREPDGSVTSLTAPTPPYIRTYTSQINNAGRCAARWEYNVGSQYFSKAFVWDAATGAQPVGLSDYYVRPLGLNNLGHVVGRSGGNQGADYRTWLWTPQGGTEELQPLVDPTNNLHLISVAGINDRGQILAEGNLQNPPPSATVQYILSPACLADFNADSFVNGDDFDAFALAFEAGAAAADIDQNGFTNGEDFDTFALAFDAGC